MINSSFVVTAIAIFLAVILVISVVMLRTMRKIYWNSKSVREGVPKAIVELGRQQEYLLQLYHLLDWPLGALPPTRDWAASPDFLCELARTILAEKPKVVVELGGGVSTLVVGRCLEKVGHGKLISFDHNSDYCQETVSRVDDRGLGGWVQCIHAPLSLVRCDSDEYQWYTVETVPENIDILIVDGPPLSLGDMSRFPAGPVFFPSLVSGGIVFLDDANREMERKVVGKWRLDFPDITFTSIRAEKGMVRGRKNL